MEYCSRAYYQWNWIAIWSYKIRLRIEKRPGYSDVAGIHEENGIEWAILNI